MGRASALQSLGFQTAILHDNDQGAPAGEVDYLASGGRVFFWHPTHALEDELFSELPDDAVHRLLDMAVEKVGEPTADAHIKSGTGYSKCGRPSEVATAWTCGEHPLPYAG